MAEAVAGWHILNIRGTIRSFVPIRFIRGSVTKRTASSGKRGNHEWHEFARMERGFGAASARSGPGGALGTGLAEPGGVFGGAQFTRGEGQGLEHGLFLGGFEA